MPAAESKPEGAPVWLELTAQDPAVAAAFYGSVLGIEVPPADDPDGRIRRLQHPGGVLGLLLAARDGEDPGWLVFLLASDVDDAVRDAVAAGGKVLTPVSAAGEQGRWAVLRDPSGARVALWEPWALPGFAVEGEPGAPGFFELRTTSGYRDAVRFYEEGLDWPITVLSDTEAFRMVVYQHDGTGLAGVYDASGTAGGAPSTWRVYFQVTDVEAAAQRVRELGGTVVHGPADSPYGRMVQALDPEGAPFALFVPPAG